MEIEDNNIELLPCSFDFYEFTGKVGETTFSCNITKMENSLYVWIGDCGEGKMNDLSGAFMSQYDTLPVATKIIGSMECTVSSNFAKKLTKKCGKPVYVSYNLKVDNMSLPKIEKVVNDELKTRPDIFKF
ncbi:proteasome assembly chaperone 4-like [Aphidius gifuensis]|uniref:proteasome assembly chaperone 4-like n=1 Tax=Aphidius gifuensis TaxID=684658 RepID=UPI001CDC8974|nr:proteasome assembly chaperone 4-like [Aphidius gifuensis]XP_044019089.1 proteasome assembly chaperone 4-like [Aphidius gifuensis]XP_044019097.1 proteasome assembly chaperone 4-like [Aphidius gifuensis]